VSTWFCNASDPMQQWADAGNGFAPRVMLKGSGTPGMCLEAVPRLAKPPGPATPPVPTSPVCPNGCQSAPCSGYAFCNRALSPQARAEDLVARLTTSEKVLMLSSVQVRNPCAPHVDLNNKKKKKKSNRTWHLLLLLILMSLGVGSMMQYEGSLLITTCSTFGTSQPHKLIARAVALPFERTVGPSQEVWSCRVLDALWRGAARPRAQLP
jgi:hypothetical protein